MASVIYCTFSSVSSTTSTSTSSTVTDGSWTVSTVSSSTVSSSTVSSLSVTGGSWTIFSTDCLVNWKSFISFYCLLIEVAFETYT